jgi:hypothetical protein
MFSNLSPNSKTLSEQKREERENENEMKMYCFSLEYLFSSSLYHGFDSCDK